MRSIRVLCNLHSRRLRSAIGNGTGAIWVQITQVLPYLGDMLLLAELSGLAEPQKAIGIPYAQKS